MILNEQLLAACREFLRSVPSSLNYVLPQDLDETLRRDPQSVFILDNRTPEAFDEGHIPGAVNIWLKDVLEPHNLSSLPTDKTIVVCCWVGHTASQLLAILRILGFDAVGLKYGMGSAANGDEDKSGWSELGLPVETAVE